MVHRVGLYLLLLPVIWAAGTWNREAGEMAAKSPMVQSAKAFLLEEAKSITDAPMRTATLDALQTGTCIAHRAGLTAQKKQAILETLIAAGFAQPSERSEQMMSGIFPPVLDEGSLCPKLPQPFEAAPGGEFGGHHSYPGGLAIHESFNLRSSLNLMAIYQQQYGPGLAMRRDLLIAAPIWHDWAKTLIFQWNADGTEFVEFAFVGTGAHHILGLAESMKRKLPADLVLTQASAHAAPVLGNEPKVVNWVRAAAIIAGVDPIAEGYLRKDTAGQLHVVHVLPEFSIHHLSDADFVFSIPAMTAVDNILKQLAPQFGFQPAESARYNTGFRNLVLSRFTAERLLLIHSTNGSGVSDELRKLQPELAGHSR